MPPTPAKTPKAAQEEVDLGLLNEVIGFRIRRIQNHLSRGFAERVAGPYMRPGVFSALALIAANPGISQTTLAREIGFDKATVVAIVDALEQLKWAKRHQSKTDRRRHSLSITSLGEQSLLGMRDSSLANEAGIYAALTEAERKTLFGLLDKIYAACFVEAKADGVASDD